MIRPHELLPQQMIDELIRLERLPYPWFFWRRVSKQHFEVNCKAETWIWDDSICTATDLFLFKSAAVWLHSGPKYFQLTRDQCRALEQIDVNLLVTEYTQPFPALLVLLDYPPFTSVLCYADPGGMVACQLFSPKHADDICITIAVDTVPMESCIRDYHPECARDREQIVLALRVALNACLALSHFGHTDPRPVYPKEQESDARLAKEDTPRGERARKRLTLTPEVIAFRQTVVLHRTECQRNGEPGQTDDDDDDDNNEQRREVTCHWRRGHWAMQAHGPGWSLRKRIFRAPVLVRADLFGGDRKDTSVTYQKRD